MSKRRKRGQKPRKSKVPGNTSQRGKALVRQLGADQQQITFPDGGQQPLKTWTLKYQKRGQNGFGSHMNGRHKRG